ncbi:hypothetical protein GCM10010503_46070 [Streptomyces lucensis JCM 4490]|uniref:Uncharacterized protein n=1 Tax=Streptomyces lucensis JCM 4490 TaxID=1306176 RepID=A0A918JAL6_9ACTN|nr:hypothetical protein [Streptomyces lucensis]GGW63756.1 hypothetical protein GCM10010503_46070 [Streptomyces lucensis JCM 4490]
MPESVPVRCPACRRAHVYTAPVYPCACGAPGAPRVDPASEPAVAAHRAWDDEWVTVPCAACGRRNQWPRPELGCPCGSVLLIPLAGMPRASPPDAPGADTFAVRRPLPPTARDAVGAAVLCLLGLGHRDVRRAGRRPSGGVGLAAHGLLAQVDATPRPAGQRDVECLWLTAMTQAAECVYFSRAGYTAEALDRAAALRIPLFALGPPGVTRPANDAAAALTAERASRQGPGAPDGD